MIPKKSEESSLFLDPSGLRIVSPGSNPVAKNVKINLPKSGYCGKMGQDPANCCEKQRDEKGASSCAYCGKLGHTEENSWSQIEANEESLKAKYKDEGVNIIQNMDSEAVAAVRRGTSAEPLPKQRALQRALYRSVPL